jgi:hypothetical protein
MNSKEDPMGEGFIIAIRLLMAEHATILEHTSSAVRPGIFVIAFTPSLKKGYCG